MFFFLSIFAILQKLHVWQIERNDKQKNMISKKNIQIGQDSQNCQLTIIEVIERRSYSFGILKKNIFVDTDKM